MEAPGSNTVEAEGVLDFLEQELALFYQLYQELKG